MSDEAMEVEVTETPAEDVDVATDVDNEVDDTPSGEGDAALDDPASPADDSASIRAEMDDLRRRTDAAEANSRAVQDVYSQTLTVQDRQRQQQEEQEAISGMTPDERLRYQGELERRELREIAQNTQAQLADQQDRNDFAMLALDNPVARQHKDEVDKRLSDAHAAGYTNVKRTTILKDLLGEKVLEGVKNGNTKQVQSAQDSRKKSDTRSTVSTGDANADTVDKVASDREARNARLAQGRTGEAYR